jgi:ABC-type transporter Mla subunit MlaD
MMHECGRVIHALQEMEQRLNQKLEKIMAADDDIKAAVSQMQTTMADVQAQVTQLGTDVTTIQAALAALPQNVDTTQLNAAVAQLAQTQANLDTAVGGVTGLVPPAPPAPAP